MAQLPDTFLKRLNVVRFPNARYSYIIRGLSFELKYLHKHFPYEVLNIFLYLESSGFPNALSQKQTSPGYGLSRLVTSPMYPNVTYDYTAVILVLFESLHGYCDFLYTHRHSSSIPGLQMHTPKSSAQYVACALRQHLLITQLSWNTGGWHTHTYIITEKYLGVITDIVLSGYGM